MKLLSSVLVLSALISSQLMAQDYYVPIKKELEPMARLPLESFELNDAKLNYRLPQDITGRPLDIQLTRDTSHSGPGRIYKGPLATASCMGTDELPACVVQHKDLRINKGELLAFAEKKYQDPRLLAQVTVVQQIFDTPNEPIGFIARRALIKPRTDLGVWESSMTLPDGRKREQVRVQLKGDSGLFRFTDASGKKRKAHGELVGELTSVFTHGAYISGHWTLQKEKGWFQWKLNSDKSGFEGSWGLISSNGSRTVEGTWTGTMP
jgi:hypothetical protein